MHVERVGALVEFAAAVVQMNPLALLDCTGGSADHYAEFNDVFAFGDGGGCNLVSVLDRLAGDDLSFSRRAANEHRPGLRRLQQSCHIILRVDLEGGRLSCHSLRCHV